MVHKMAKKFRNPILSGIVKDEKIVTHDLKNYKEIMKAAEDRMVRAYNKMKRRKKQNGKYISFVQKINVKKKFQRKHSKNKRNENGESISKKKKEKEREEKIK